MDVVRKVPVTKHEGENFALGRNVGSQTLNAIESLFIRAGREVGAPDIEITFCHHGSVPQRVFL